MKEFDYPYVPGQGGIQMKDVLVPGLAKIVSGISCQRVFGRGGKVRTLIF